MLIDSHLTSALLELQRLGAKGLLGAEIYQKATVQKGVPGPKWFGKLSDGGNWELIKNSNSSYNVKTTPGRV